MFEQFEVILAAGDFDGRGTLVHCFDGRQLVLTAIPREALEDYFRSEGVTPGECALVVERNIEAFRSIIVRKYAGRDFTTYTKHGQTYPLITILREDMERSGETFSDSVVAMARAARWG